MLATCVHRAWLYMHNNDALNSHNSVINCRIHFCLMVSGPPRAARSTLAHLTLQSVTATISLTLPSCSAPDLSVTFYKLKSQHYRNCRNWSPLQITYVLSSEIWGIRQQIWSLVRYIYDLSMIFYRLYTRYCQLCMWYMAVIPWLWLLHNLHSGQTVVYIVYYWRCL